MDDLDLWGYQNKRVVVTGAASGMGLACVDLLNRLGADVIALDLEKPVPPVAQFVEVDMRDPRSIDSASAAIDPPVHALFNVVGIPPIRPGVEVFTINFIGPRHLTERIVPKMTEGGAIANVATILVGLEEAMPAVRQVLAIEGFDGLLTWAEANTDKVADGYMFSKQCFCGYTLQQAPQLVKNGIRINIIGPSTTDTPFLDKLHAVMPGIADRATTVSGRRSTPEEQASVLVFLNSAMPTYMTGAVIANDGGQLTPPDFQPTTGNG